MVAVSLEWDLGASIVQKKFLFDGIILSWFVFNGLVEVVFTNYMQATLRGEEGMTLLFVCCNPNCGHRWRDWWFLDSNICAPCFCYGSDDLLLNLNLFVGQWNFGSQSYLVLNLLIALWREMNRGCSLHNLAVVHSQTSHNYTFLIIWLRLSWIAFTECGTLSSAKSSNSTSCFTSLLSLFT